MGTIRGVANPENLQKGVVREAVATGFAGRRFPRLDLSSLLLAVAYGKKPHLKIGPSDPLIHEVGSVGSNCRRGISSSASTVDRTATENLVPN